MPAIITNSGIKRIIYEQGYPDEFSVQLLKEAGVSLERMVRE